MGDPGENEEQGDSSDDEFLDDSIFFDSMESTADVESDEVSISKEKTKATSSISDFSVSRICKAFQLQNLSQLGIPLRSKNLEGNFKLVEEISLKKVIDITPAVKDSVVDILEPSLELCYIDGKKKTLQLLPSPNDGFDYYPFTGRMFPATLLNHWLISLRQANNLKNIQINPL